MPQNRLPRLAEANFLSRNSWTVGDRFVSLFFAKTTFQANPKRAGMRKLASIYAVFPHFRRNDPKVVKWIRVLPLEPVFYGAMRCIASRSPGGQRTVQAAQQLLRSVGLGQKALHVQGVNLVECVLRSEAADGDDFRVRIKLSQCPYEGESIHNWHHQIGDHDVDPPFAPPVERYGFRSIGR